MKNLASLTWAATLMLAAGLSANAQGAGGDKGIGSGTATLGEQGGQRQRPSPEQMAERLVTKYDANKDKELSQDELVQALEALRQHRRHGAGGGGQGGGSDAATLGGKRGQRHGTQGGGQANLGQNAAGSEHQGPPPADKVATKMIERFSSDKKGLTQVELAKAIAERQANRGQHRGGKQGGGRSGGTGSNQ